MTSELSSDPIAIEAVRAALAVVEKTGEQFLAVLLSELARRGRDADHDELTRLRDAVRVSQVRRRLRAEIERIRDRDGDWPSGDALLPRIARWPRRWRVALEAEARQASGLRVAGPAVEWLVIDTLTLLMQANNWLLLGALIFIEDTPGAETLGDACRIRGTDPLRVRR
jgi:hypothetical protein